MSDDDAAAGILLGPTDAEYHQRCSGWNSRIVHRPEHLVAATTPKHVEQAVRFAAGRCMPIRVQSTGHGALAACKGGMLIDTSGLGGIVVDPRQRCAVVGAGVRWEGLLDAAQIHDLTGISGSSTGVGVVGYATGGGAGWLSRRYGLCSDTIEAAEVVTIDGARRWVSADVEPDLLWALRGGGANFAVVTTLRLRLVPTPMVYAGAVYWPMEMAQEVLTAYRVWLKTVPPDLGSAVAFLQYPATAPVPEPVRGKPVVALRVCHTGAADQFDAIIAPMRHITGIVLDTTRWMPYREIGSVTMDSPLHLPRIGYSESLRELSDSIIAGLPKVLTPGGPFIAMELRHTADGMAAAPVGYEGLGYWSSSFLFMGVSITPDASSELQAVALGKQLDAVLRPYVAETKTLTFLMAQHKPTANGEAGRVRTAFQAEHYMRLAAIKARYDPRNLLGGDRNIPPLT